VYKNLIYNNLQAFFVGRFNTDYKEIGVYLLVVFTAKIKH